MLRRVVVLLTTMALIVIFAPPSFAQSVAVAQLSGTVTDESGGVLPGASVTVTQTNTGATRSVVTGSNGNYVFASLPIGPYKLAATMPGFNAFEQTGITLNVGDTRSVRITLKIGAMTDTVKVTADANLVQTQTLSVGQVTSQELIVGLPLNGRSATQLLLLEGGAVEGGGGSGNRGVPGQVTISVAGSTSTSTQYLVDGGYNNDPSASSGNAIPFPDALQEFTTQSGVRDARFGMSTGATVNAVTKSGTNEFHGNVFDFARNYRFNSLSFFDRPENGGDGEKDGLNRHQFGGTMGGPVLRDKLFFFAGVQATVNHRVPLNNNNNVPTAAMLAGDFRQVMSLTCRGGTTVRTLSAPYVDNQVSPSLFSPFAMSLLKFVPLPDPAVDVDGCGRYQYRFADNSEDQQYVERMDYQLSENKRVFFRDTFSYSSNPAAFNNNIIIANRNSGNRALAHSVASGLDYVITQRLFSSTRFSFQHTKATRESGMNADGTHVPTLGALGVNAWMYHQSKTPGQNQLKAGVFTTGNTGVFYSDTPQISQDFDWTRGSHSLAFGGSWTRPGANGDGPFQADGNMGFSGAITSSTGAANGGLNFADFMLGYATSYTGGGSQINNAYVHTPGIYFNDVWRVSRRITMNYGLRYDPFLAPKDRNGFVGGFSRENFDKGIRSIVYPNAPIGMMYKGDPGFPDNNANTFNKYKLASPRFGVVWDPSGDGRQTIRSGFGVYFATPRLWYTAHQMLNAPFGNTTSAVVPTTCPNVVKRAQNGCPLDVFNPWSSTPGGDPMANFAHHGETVRLPGSSAVFPAQNQIYTSLPVDADPERSYQYNLSYQRQLMSRVLLDVTYTGNQQRHTWVSGYAESLAIFIPGNCAPGQYPGVTEAAPACTNNTAANRNARGILRLLNPVEGAKYGVNSGGGSGDTGIAQLGTDASGYYNGLKIGVQKRLSSGWSANANYTISKCINQGEPSTDIGWNIPVALKDPVNDPHPDYKSAEGACANDRRHLFNLSSVLISPGLFHGFLNTLTKDWQVGLIVTARSGSPLSPSLSVSAMNDGSNERPNMVPGVNPILAEPFWIKDSNGINQRIQYIDMTAFSQPEPGTRGNATRGIIHGPGAWNVDAAFSRNLNLGAGRRVEVRVEAFNLFNHSNWGNPSVSLGGTNPGTISQLNGSRVMQFALKYGF